MFLYKKLYLFKFYALLLAKLLYFLFFQFSISFFKNGQKNVQFSFFDLRIDKKKRKNDFRP